MGDLDLLPSKVLALLVRPDFWLWLGLLAALWTLGRGWTRIGWWITLSMVAAVTLVGFVPVGGVWLGPLESRFPANPTLTQPPAAIIVLGGGEDTATSTAWGSTNLNGAGDRLAHAVRRAQEFPQTPVLFTGGAYDPLGDPLLADSENLVSRFFEEMGLAAERIHSIGAARVTAEHPEDVQQILAELDIEPGDEARLLLITSAFHMPRAIGVFCQSGVGPVIADPTDHRTTPGRSWLHAIKWDYAHNLTNLQLGIREWAGLVAYHARGQIPALLPEGC